MPFIRNILLFSALLFNLNLVAQTKSFSSKNIDSLLKAYESHKKVGLPKAYCIDQIVRFYSTKKDFIKASTYNNEFKQISTTLKHKDVSHRYAYRNTYLNFLISERKKLDTIVFTKTYKYFKKFDPKMCPFIADQMVSYLKGSDGFGAEWLKDYQQLVSWYILSGEDNYEFGYFDDSSRVFYNASLNLSFSDSTKMETILKKAIRSNNKAKKKITYQIYMRLTELYCENKNNTKVLKLEKEILAMNNKNLQRDFYAEVSYNNIHGKGKDILTQVEKVKKDLRLKQLKDSCMVANLPQGSFYYDFHNVDFKKASHSLKISKSTITKKSIDDYEKDSITYVVHLSYPISKNTKLLSVKKTKGDYETWKFIVMRLHDDFITINDKLVWENSMDSQLESMSELLDKKNKTILLEALKPRVEEYYPTEIYDSLCQFPIITEKDIPDLKSAFFSSLKKTDETYKYLFTNLIEDYSFSAKGTDSLKIILKHLLIKKGYQPFESIPVIAEYESNMQPKRKEQSNGFVTLVFVILFFIGKPWIQYALLFIAVFGVFWLVYKSRINRKNNHSNRPFDTKAVNSKKTVLKESKRTKSYMNKVVSILGIIGLVIIGCILGFLAGKTIGQGAGYTGGNSIGWFMLAVLGTPIGGTIGLVVGILISQKRHKA